MDNINVEYDTTFEVHLKCKTFMIMTSKLFTYLCFHVHELHVFEGGLTQLHIWWMYERRQQ
jgi:hypothetical protein